MSTLSLVAVIGFESVVYNVDEDTGFVEVTIGVLEGELEPTVSVDFSTLDGTAIGIRLASANNKTKQPNQYVWRKSWSWRMQIFRT